ncbi:UNVERIFIED_CONTAM: hypothetical protein RMT77_012297 [Armadillidium vulgare]
MVRIIVALLAVCSVAFARMAYQLPPGSETILRTATFTESFSCDGLPYGYYADDANNCEIFHICYPINDEEGNLLETAQFSFVCPNQTIFNQESLTCVLEGEAVPCGEARSLFESSNAGFGVILDQPDQSIDN